MREYFYPNEVDIEIENGVRVAYLKHNWKDIRKANESKTTNTLTKEEWEVIHRRLFAETIRKFK
mgnify:CR=1 FL=1